MDDIPKSALQAVVFALLFILLFLILLPFVVKSLDEPSGRILYGVLSLGALLVAFRLRALFRGRE